MIRVAKREDAEELLKIYSYYVENTAITFEYDVPSVEEFSDRISNTLKKYPYLVLEEEGKILGYTYAGEFKSRAAYDRAVETTIYMDKNLKHRGMGKKLYKALEQALELQKITNLYACIAYPKEEDEYLTKNSVESVSYTHLRAHETRHDLVCRLLLEKKKNKRKKKKKKRI